MKRFAKIISVVSLCVFLLSVQVFAATAHLEGSEGDSNKISLFENLDSSVIMANWYKIALIAVAVLCVAGLIFSNIMWIVKKRNKQ